MHKASELYPLSVEVLRIVIKHSLNHWHQSPHALTTHSRDGPGQSARPADTDHDQSDTLAFVGLLRPQGMLGDLMPSMQCRSRWTRLIYRSISVPLLRLPQYKYRRSQALNEDNSAPRATIIRRQSQPSLPFCIAHRQTSTNHHRASIIRNEVCLYTLPSTRPHALRRKHASRCAYGDCPV